jgi:hypothetical protein
MTQLRGCWRNSNVVVILRLLSADLARTPLLCRTASPAVANA